MFCSISIRALARACARACGAVLMLASVSAFAQDPYPRHPVKIIIPYAPGGSADNVGRIVGKQLGSILGQPFIIENTGGSGGIAAMNSLLRSSADGYTLFLGDAGQWAINVALYKKLPYNPLTDLVPVSTLTYAPLFLVVNQSVPANSLQDLVALIKSKPGVYSYASSGVGSPHHLAMETFKSALGLDILHVPFKGTGQSMPALASGEVSMALVGSLPSVESYLKSGRLKLIAASTAQRSDMAPGLPAMSEAGVPGFDFPGELALLAPRGTPQPVIDRLAEAVAKAIHSPDALASFKSVGVGPAPDPSSAHLAQTIRNDLKKYGDAVRISGATVD